jgi:hypothetical protein
MIEKIRNMIAFASPVRVIERPESLVVLDYRPTWVMAFCLGGFVGMASLFVIMLRGMGSEWLSGLIVCALVGAACLFAATTQSIREVYYFDMPTDSYRFVRQYVHRKEVIEGGMDQFTGAHVKTVTQDEGESYHVVLRQEGMFLTGVSEQTLREETPIFNSFSNEARIANAISSIVSIARHERSKKKG